MSSGLPLKADIALCSRHVSKVPISDIGSVFCAIAWLAPQMGTLAEMIFEMDAAGHKLRERNNRLAEVFILHARGRGRPPCCGRKLWCEKAGMDFLSSFRLRALQVRAGLPGTDGPPQFPYWRTSARSMVMRPLDIMPSSTGRKASIFSFESTISTTTGRSCDKRRILVVWMRLEWPKPM